MIARLLSRARRHGALLALLAFLTPRPAWAVPFPVDPALPLATGAFVQLNLGSATNSAAWWHTELNSMKATGMDTVIVQYVAYDDYYYYPTAVPGGIPLATDSIANILGVADQLNMDVFVGLQLDTSQYSSGTFDLDANLQRGEATMQELTARYGSHVSFAGWYLPQEISDFMVFYQPPLRDNIVAYMGTMSQLAHTSTGRPVMISPYFGQNPNGPLYAQWWNTTGLPQTGIDILALQDGVGTHRTTTEESRTVFAAMEPVLANHDVAFWANNESFNQIHGWPVDAAPWQAVPTAINTFVDQLEATTPLVQKSVTFEFTHYMSTQKNAASLQLYQDYQAYFLSLFPLLGDVNLDEAVNGLDVDPFVDRLVNDNYQVEADMNEDGLVNGLDVNLFVAALVGGGVAIAANDTAVPEPSTLALACVAMFACLFQVAWKHQPFGSDRNGTTGL